MAHRPGRTPLTRSRVVSTAITLADTGGITAVSMRAVGAALGVEAMSLYHHVADKQDLLEAMIDDIFARIDLQPAAQRWRETTQQWAQTSYRALSSHHWALTLLASRSRLGPAALAHHNYLLAVLGEAGLSPSASGHVVSLVDSYVCGFIMRCATGQPAASVSRQGAADPPLGHRSAGRSQHHTEFLVGLHILLDGISTRFAPYMVDPIAASGSIPSEPHTTSPTHLPPVPGAKPAALAASRRPTNAPGAGVLGGSVSGTDIPASLR